MKMRKWSSFWICFRRTGGMRRCCLNKTEDRCCCRCWWWQSMVIEGLLWALSHGRRQSAQQDSKLCAGLFAIIWVELAQGTNTVTHSTIGITKGYIHKSIFTLYIAPLLTTCNINDAWKQTIFRIPQMGIKAFSSCTTVCQGGPTVSPCLLQAEAVPCGPVPWPELFVHCLLLTMPQYNSNIINQSSTVKK